MGTTSDYQIIKQNGKNLFVLVPWADFKRIQPMLEGHQSREDEIPKEVMIAHCLKGVPIIKAWREHLGLTQAKLAERAGMKQKVISVLEKPGHKPRHATMERIAKALGIEPAQLDVYAEAKMKAEIELRAEVSDLKLR